MARDTHGWKWYGWRVLALATLGHYFGYAASTIHSFGLFIVPVTKEFGWTRAQISLANTIANITVVVVAPYIGVLMDRFGPKFVLVPSTFCLGVLLCALHFSHGNLWGFYAIFLLLGLLGAGTMGPVFARLILSWFESRKGLALGIVLGGAGASSVINPPLLSWIIATAGWRQAYLFLGLMNLVVILPLTWLFVRNTPEEMGQTRDGDAAKISRPDAQPLAASADRGYSFRAGIRKAIFWKIALLFFALGFGQATCVHFIPLLQSHGLTAATAAFVASVFGMAMLIARLTSGALMDHWRPDRIAAVLVGASGVGFALLLFLPGSTEVAFIAACFLGMIYGAESNFMGFFVVDYFGRFAAGKFLTSIFSIFSCGSAIGVYWTGLLFDHFGGYRYPLVISLVTAGGGILLLLSFGSRPQSLPKQSDELHIPAPA